MMVAARHQDLGSVVSFDPVLQVVREGFGDAQFGQHDDGRAGPDGVADESVEVRTLCVEMRRLHRKRGLAGIVGKGEFGEAAVGVAGGNDRFGGDQFGGSLDETVVEHNTELRGPSSGQPDVAGLVQPVRQSPGRRRGLHIHHRPDVGSSEWDRVSDTGLVRAAAAEGVGEELPVMVVEELGQLPGHHHGRDCPYRLQRIDETASRCRVQRRGGRTGTGEGAEGLEHLGHGGLGRGVAGLLPQHGMFVTAQVQ
nr:hypothetical protein [Rhodococcus pyridinivorans]